MRAFIDTKYNLKTLDSIQLASAILSESDCFVTSDRKLCAEARKVLPSVRYI